MKFSVLMSVYYKENPNIDENGQVKKKPAKKADPKKGKPLSKVKAKRALAEKKEAERKQAKRDFYSARRNIKK